MAKKETLEKQKAFLKKSPFNCCIDESTLEIHEPLKNLCDKELFMEAVLECLEKNDLAELLEITEIHLSALHRKALFFMPENPMAFPSLGMNGILCVS